MLKAQPVSSSFVFYVSSAMAMRNQQNIRVGLAIIAVHLWSLTMTTRPWKLAVNWQQSATTRGCSPEKRTPWIKKHWKLQLPAIFAMFQRKMYSRRARLDTQQLSGGWLDNDLRSQIWMGHCLPILLKVDLLPALNRIVKPNGTNSDNLRREKRVADSTESFRSYLHDLACICCKSDSSCFRPNVPSWFKRRLCQTTIVAPWFLSFYVKTWNN